MTTQDPISRPPAVHGTRFNRGLLFFSIIFSLLILADLGIVGKLLFRDLSRQVLQQAREEAREALENLSTNLKPTQRGLFYLVQTRRQFSRYVDHNLQQATSVLWAGVVDAEGRWLATWTRRARVKPRESPGDLFSSVPGRDGAPSREFSEQGAEIVPGELLRPRAGRRPPESSDPAIKPGTPPEEPEVLREASALPRFGRLGLPNPVRELDTAGPGDFTTVSLRGRVQAFTVTVPVELGPGQTGTLTATLDPAELDAKLADQQRGLVFKVMVGAVFSVLLIVVAYIFVVKLFQKTRRLESEAQMADRLAYVGTLAAGLAHEIRNPLSAMKLNLQLLETGLEDEHRTAAAGIPDDEVRELLGETRAEVDRLGRLVTSFLSYARPPRLERQPTDLNQVCEEIVRFMQADAAARGVAMELTTQASLPMLSLDATQVRQAVLNIVKNAVAAVETAGVGTVRLITSWAGTGDVRLTVEDDGRGIAPEKMPHIFQVFYSGRPGGSGLGLAIARRVVEGHDGRIEVDSAPGSGSRFTLVFPVPGGRSSLKAAL